MFWTKALILYPIRGLGKRGTRKDLVWFVSDANQKSTSAISSVGGHRYNTASPSTPRELKRKGKELHPPVMSLALLHDRYRLIGRTWWCGFVLNGNTGLPSIVSKSGVFTYRLLEFKKSLDIDLALSTAGAFTRDSLRGLCITYTKINGWSYYKCIALKATWICIKNPSGKLQEEQCIYNKYISCDRSRGAIFLKHQKDIFRCY